MDVKGKARGVLAFMKEAFWYFLRAIILVSALAFVGEHAPSLPSPALLCVFLESVNANMSTEEFVDKMGADCEIGYLDAIPLITPA